MYIEHRPGEMIHQTIQRAIQTASNLNQEVYIKCHDMTLRVYPGSHEYDIQDKYNLACSVARAKGFY